MTTIQEEIRASVADAAFGGKLVMNVHRGHLAEAMVSKALPAEWKWLIGDYFPYDLKHADGTRLEVKQSAAVQTWASKGPSVARWDIAARRGYYDGPVFVEQEGRNADIYVLARHFETDRDKANHFDPSQWLFFVVRASALPSARSITIGPLTRIGVSPVPFAQLRAAVESLRCALVHV